VLTLAGTGVGTVSLSWSAVEDASDYVVLYGTESGTYLYAAVVGNSNEVNTGAILGGAGVGGPATGFQEAGNVLGEQTEKESTKSKKTTKGALTDSQDEGEVLGIEKVRSFWDNLWQYFKDNPLIIFFSSLSLIFLLYLLARALRRRLE